MASNRAEAALVRHALTGDSAAGEELFARYWPLARRAAFAISASDVLAEEIAQDAFEILLRRLGDFRGEASLAVWLTRIVVNRARNVVRHEERSVPQAEPGRELVDDGVATPVIADPTLIGAVRALAPERRQVIALRYWLDMDPGEISEVLEIPLGTVHSRLSRGIAELRTRLEVEHERA